MVEKWTTPETILWNYIVWLLFWFLFFSGLLSPLFKRSFHGSIGELILYKGRFTKVLFNTILYFFSEKASEWEAVWVNSTYKTSSNQIFIVLVPSIKRFLLVSQEKNDDNYEAI